MLQTRNYFIDHEEELQPCEVDATLAKHVIRSDKHGQYTSVDLYKKGRLVDEYHREADASWVENNPSKYAPMNLKQGTRDTIVLREVSRSRAMRKAVESRLNY